MNEPITTPRKSLLFKIYQPAILALLTAILIMQIITLATEGRSSECKAAIEYAQTIIQEQPATNMVSEYQSAVYDGGADNINQQIFLANEFNFMTLQKIDMQQGALLNITASCK